MCEVHLFGVYLFVEGRGSRVEGRGSRVEGRGSRVEGRGSRVEGRGSRVLCVFSKSPFFTFFVVGSTSAAHSSPVYMFLPDLVKCPLT